VLGLLRVPDDPAAMVLAELGVGLPAARATVENAVGKGVGPVLGQIEATAALRTLLGVATREAEDAGQELVGALHLLHALAADPDETTRQVLDELGITSAAIQSRLQALLDESGDEAADDASGEGLTPEDIEQRLSDDARAALGLAHDEAAQLRHESVNLVHLLLGLLGNDLCLAARSLQRAGLTQADLRRATEFVLGPGTASLNGDRPRSPKVWKALQLADVERRRHGHAAIGTGHVLLGIIHSGDSVAGGLCELLGVRLSRVAPLLGTGLDQPPD
jgi:ATP-dependent Clp protease ATP-binding subunit ClpA